MRIGSHEYANEADDDDDVPKPAQSLGTPVSRQKSVNCRDTTREINTNKPMQGYKLTILKQ